MSGKMGEETPETLRERLELKEKEIDLVLAIDHIRDTLPEPPAMLVAIANIRDQHLPFNEMLNKALQELRAVVQAEAGFIMLYNQTGQQLELRATTHDDLFRVLPHCKVVDRLANEALQRAEMVCDNNLGDVLRSMLCILLILHDEIIGVLGVVNRYGPRGFRAEGRGLSQGRAVGAHRALLRHAGLHHTG